MVSVSDVPDAFANIADSIPHTLDLDSFLGYLESTWVSGDLEPDRQSGHWDGQDGGKHPTAREDNFLLGRRDGLGRIVGNYHH